MFTAHNIYVHRRTLDIALRIDKVQYRGPKYWKVKATVANRHNGIVYETKVFRINKSDFCNWSLYA